MLKSPLALRQGRGSAALRYTLYADRPFTECIAFCAAAVQVGLNYICATAERFFAVGAVLGNMVVMLAEQPSPRLLKHIIRCYLRLSDNPRWVGPGLSTGGSCDGGGERP